MLCGCNYKSNYFYKAPPFNGKSDTEILNAVRRGELRF
jgi:hypothetical protein